MTVLIGGVDEAGLGPLLGPLTVGWSVLSVPQADSNPWELLSDVVAPAPKGASKRIVVADSKKVYSRNAPGRARLERTALSFLTQVLDAVPQEPRGVLFGCLRAPEELVSQHPWYAQLSPLPRHQGADLLELSAAALARGLKRAKVSFVDGGVRLVPAGELNASYRETNNKGETTWLRTLEVLVHIWRSHGKDAPCITVDLQGARQKYGAALARGFPEASVTRIEERANYASYRLDERGKSADTWRPRRMELIFREKGDVHSFPTALASCFAKYAREISMEAFNAYFQKIDPDLKATAGYTTDGRRWLEDARSILGPVELHRDVLIRTR
ncbi:MAG: ribonuclease HII [Planctomycetota bacterium]|jgi:ribonuclease HII